MAIAKVIADMKVHCLMFFIKQAFQMNFEGGIYSQFSKILNMHMLQVHSFKVSNQTESWFPFEQFISLMTILKFISKLVAQ